MIEFFQKHWGDIGSIVGLLISIWTLRVSIGARKAAQEAKQSIQRKTLAQDLKSCADESAHLVTLCSQGEWKVGSHVATQVSRELMFLYSRWEGELDAKARNSLQLAVNQLNIASNRLRHFSTTVPTLMEQNSVVFVVGRINLSLIAEHGRYESMIDSYIEE